MRQQIHKLSWLENKISHLEFEEDVVNGKLRSTHCLESIIGLQKSFFPTLFERNQNKMKQNHTHTSAYMQTSYTESESIHQTIIICHFCFVTKTIKIIKHGVYNQLVRSSDLMFYICAQRMSQMSSRTHTHSLTRVCWYNYR